MPKYLPLLSQIMFFSQCRYHVTADNVNDQAADDTKTREPSSLAGQIQLNMTVRTAGKPRCCVTKQKLCVVGDVSRNECAT